MGDPGAPHPHDAVTVAAATRLPVTVADVDRQPVTVADVDRLLRQGEWMRLPQPDPDLEALYLAILLEEAFGVTLTDDEIDRVVLCDPRSAHDVIIRHLGES